MSSTPPVSAPPVVPVHPAWYSRAATWLLKVGNAIKGVILKIGSEMPAVQAEILKIAPTAEAISNIFLPGSGAFEAHLLDVWGVVANAVKGTSDAAAANGVVVNLDAAMVADIKAILPAVEQFLHPAASPAPPPKGT